MAWSVYIHITPSNKYYVGITSKEPCERWRNGFGYYSQKYFYNAIQKYGWDNIYHEIVASNLTKEEANNFEKLLIQKRIWIQYYNWWRWCCRCKAYKRMV